ncbi:MAG: hypothetical protein K2W99_00865 [Chthoniobacterales bacterium]|nr:hypothetical protein [Chthoniobacterales bacterium]
MKKPLLLLLLIGPALLPLEVNAMGSEEKKEEHKELSDSKETLERNSNEQWFQAQKKAAEKINNSAADNNTETEFKASVENEEMVKESTLQQPPDIAASPSSAVENGDFLQLSSPLDDANEESEKENLSNLTTLEERIQEAREVVSDLTGKGAAIEQRKLQDLFKKWSDCSERYQEAQSSLLERNNNAGLIEQQQNEPRLKKLRELVEASGKVLLQLKQFLQNFSHDTVRASELSELNISENEKNFLLKMSSKEVTHQALKRKEYTLTLEDFQKAVENHATSERFIIVKNKKEKIASLQSLETKDANEKKVAAENEEIFKALKNALREKYAQEEIGKKFPKEEKQHAPWSAKKLREVFSYFEKITPKASNETVSLEKHQELITNFCNTLQQAQEATQEGVKIQEKLKNQHESWYLDSIDIYQINLANYHTIQAKLDEIAKVASVRIHQCKKDKINLKGPLDADLSFLSQFCSGYHPVQKMIEEANSDHEEWNNLLKTGAENRHETRTRTQAQWEQILKEVKNIQDLFNKSDLLQNLEEELQHFQKTYGYFKERQKTLDAAFSQQQQLTDQCWEKVFLETDQLLSKLLSEKSGKLMQGISESSLKAKISFEKADRIAANCLEDKNTYFFQEEQQRSHSLKEMCLAWGKKLEKCKDEHKKLLKEKTSLQDFLTIGKKLKAAWEEIPYVTQNSILPFIETEEIVFKTEEEISRVEQKLTKKEEELSALERSIEATKTIQKAEAILTESTKIEWKPSDLVPKNNWANSTLYDAFVETRDQALRARKQALQSEETLLSQLTQAQQNYNQLEKLLSHSSTLPAEQIATFTKNLGEAWNKANQEANKSRKLWDKAREAILTAKEKKISWAKNLLRLAGSATGDFSLGEATKRDAELLGKLWIGLEAAPWSKSSETINFPDDVSETSSLKEENIDGFLSNDQLRRFRTLSYKPNFKKYQVNFERRSSHDKTWQGNEQNGSIAWGNGHLTIINPHIEDREENAMSLKFATLKPVDWSEEVYQEKETLLKMNIEGLLLKGRKEQERLKEIQNHIEISLYDKREEEVRRLSQEKRIIETELLTIIKEAKEACQEGLDMAPKDKKEWWNLRFERIELELESDDKNLQYWEKILTSKEKRDSIQNNRIKESKAAYDLVPEREIPLRDFWKTKIKKLEQETKHQRAQECYGDSKIKYIKMEHCINEFLKQPLDSNNISLETVLQKIEAAKLALDRTVKECQHLLTNELDAPEMMISFWKRASATCEEEKRRLTLLKQYFEDKNREREIGIMIQKAKETLPQHEDPALTSKVTAAIAAKREEQLADWEKLLQLYHQEYKSLTTLEENSWRNHSIWWEQQAESIGLRRNEIIIEQLRSKLEQISSEAKVPCAQANSLPFSLAGISLWQQALQKNRALNDAARNLEWEAIRQLQLKANGSLPCNELQEQKLKAVLEKSLTTKKYCTLQKGVLQTHEATSRAVNSHSVSNGNEKELFERALGICEQAIEELNAATNHLSHDPEWSPWLQETLSVLQEKKKMCSDQLESIQKKVKDSAKERLHDKLQEQKKGRQKK